MGGASGDDISDDSHARIRRVYIGVTDHEFFQNVVLYGAGELTLIHPLFLGGHHVAGKNRQYCTVHGHGNRNLIQWNTVKKNLHVFNRINSNPCLANIAGNSRMVRVITPVRRQIKGH